MVNTIEHCGTNMRYFNPFSTLIINITRDPSSSATIISRENYEIFCKEYIFDQLVGTTFAEAFCKRFDITDSAISILQDNDHAKSLIESLGYIT